MDRDELGRIVTRALEEAADCVGDRDQPPGRPREGAIDVAEWPQQVAVVVVARRDDRDPERARRDRSVHVGVNQVSVDEIRPLGAHRTDHVSRQPRADVRPAAHRAVRDAELVERVVEPRGVTPRDVETEKACIDTPLAQGGEQREQVALRAADTHQLVQVEDLHPSSRR